MAGIKFNGPRYMTRGVAATLSPALVGLLWAMVDDLPEERDYLQVFDLSSTGAFQKIVHRTEEPEYHREYAIPLKDLDGAEPVDDKVYIIDDGENATMLLAEEY